MFNVHQKPRLNRANMGLQNNRWITTFSTASKAIDGTSLFVAFVVIPLLSWKRHTLISEKPLSLGIFVVKSC